jgi:2-C-methyl-D-erythritol 4-phosphate cytidylyltransferase
VIVAAGEGSRLGAGPKAFVTLAGLPMMAHSLVALAKTPGIEGIVLVLPEARVIEGAAVAASIVPAARVEVAPGGPTRQESVRRGLADVPEDVDRVVVHDAARPLAAPALFEAALAALAGAAGAVAAVPERDTLKRERDGRVVETVSRAGLWRAQTPQAFHAAALRRAHERAAAEGFAATDDAMLLEWVGESVAIVPGDDANIKIATPEELALAEAILATRERGA